MKLEQRATVPAPRERVWDLVMDVPRVARCVPGMIAVEPLGDDRHRGTLRVQVGPIKLTLEGVVAIVARDPANGSATMRAEGSDGSGGGVRALLDLRLAEAGAGTELRVTSDVQVLGRIGELGQFVIKRKADQLMSEFAANLAKELE